jgi:glycosidase
LTRLIPWLDYVADLGCTGVVLGPIFASEGHGYDTTDPFRIDPRLGDDGDFDTLVAELGARGLRLVLDGVFNHVGRSFAPLADVLVRGAASPWSRWFRRIGDGSSDLATFEGHHGLVTLNHDEPAVADHVVEVMRHWLDRGAHGWRLDAAYAVPRPFWRSVIERVRGQHPDAWFVAEVIHGDYRDFVEETGVDSITQYELWKAIWSSINDGNLFELQWALARTEPLLEVCAPLTFVGNHDVTRIASRIEDERHLAHAIVILLTTGGVPSIYAGDEQGYTGIKEDRVGGDDAVRPAFPEGPEALWSGGWWLHDLHRSLLVIRRERPWLARAATEVVAITNRSMVMRSGRPGTADALTTAINLDDDPLELPAGRLLLADPTTTGSPTAVAPHGWAIVDDGP